MIYTLKLTGGQRYAQATGGRVLLIDDIGAASGVDVTLVDDGRELATIPGRVAAFKLVQKFESVVFQSNVDATIRVFLSNNDVDLGYRSGITVVGAVSVTNTPDVHVTNTPNVAVTNVPDVHVTNTPTVTVGNNDAAAVPTRHKLLTTVTNIAPVSVGVAQTALVNDATLLQLRIRNAHATATIAIGPTGVTLVNGAVVLGPGEQWIEEDAPGIAWFAISDTAATSVQIQGLK
jgi:hypothetical protein